MYRFYVWFNIHIVSEDDWNRVNNILINIPGVEYVESITSTEAIVYSRDYIYNSIRSVKFIDKVGEVLQEFDRDDIQGILNFAKSLNAFIIPRVSDIALRSLLRSFSGRDFENIVVVRDFYRDSKLKVVFIKCLDIDKFLDFVDKWYRTFSKFKPYFIVCNIESDHEVVSCVRIASALDIKLYLVNPRLRFRDRRLLNEFKKFLSISKTRVITRRNLRDVIDRYFKGRKIVCLSMHTSSGEIDLLDLLEKCDVKDLVFVIGGERWGLCIDDVDVCDYFIRLGPASGIPMSISEVMSYITSMLRLYLHLKQRLQY